MAPGADTPLPPDPVPPSERIRSAQVEIGHTTIAPRVASTLVAAFLLLLCLVPALQLREGRPPVQSGSGLLRRAGAAVTDEPSSAGATALQALMAGNRALLAAMERIERDLDDGSVAGRAIRPWVQSVLTRPGAGTEQVYQGRDRWLFYRPDVDYLTGAGFLDRVQLTRRAATGDTLTPPPQPDPVAAIRHLRGQLTARGIALIVMPTPVKPSLHPEKLTGDDHAPGVPVENASYRAFGDALREDGVLVFDAAAVLAQERRDGTSPLYLASDTHWRPEAVEAAARHLHAFIRQHVDLSPRSPVGYMARLDDIENTGDTFRLLSLPAGQSLYAPERVRVRRVLTPTGERWAPDATADVLVLGDSFSNIYSVGGMGWGEAAGLVEQLSFEMQRPIDRLARNDDGAFASRDMLAAELRRGRDRLAGKRVVIFQFAARELSFGNWKIVRFEPGDVASRARFLTPLPGQSLSVVGIVRAIGPVPRPGRVPYKDHIVAVHLGALSAGGTPLDPSRALVYVWSMRDNVPTEASRYRIGDVVTIELRPWNEVARGLEGINRGELDAVELQLAEPWWGSLSER